MKILYLTDQTYLHGGIEKVLSQKANYFADVSGDEVVIVSYNQQGKKPVYDFSSKITWHDLNINYEIEKSYFNPNNLKKMPKHVAALKKCLAEINPDIIISSNFGPDFYFLPYLKRSIPKIKEFHGSRCFYTRQKKSAKKKFLDQLTKVTEKNYSAIVALNTAEKHFYANDCVAVIPNPAQISAKRADVNSPKIMAAGRIAPVKNFGDLIEAFSRVAPQFPAWELHFFGEDYGGTQQKLEEKVRKKGLQHQIKFKGIAADLKEEMRNYSIYAMTSETECFPMVLLEALSVGMPVISYNCPTGPQYIIEDEVDSFLVPYKNLDIFTEKLRVLMSDENLRIKMGNAGSKNMHRFHIEKVMHQWKNLLVQLISKH